MTTPVKVGDPLVTVATPYVAQIWAAAGGSLPVLVANLSTTTTVYVGYSQGMGVGTINAVPVAPQQAFAFDGSRTLYAVAAANTPVLLLPGATQYFSGNISILNSNLNVTVTGGTITATVSGSVSILGTPSVTISGTPTVSVTGTPNVNVSGQSVALDVSAATVVINPVAGATFPPGGIAQIASLGAQTINPNGNFATSVFNVQSYLGYAFNVTAYCGSQTTNGAPLVGQLLVQWYADAGGTIPVYQERWWYWLGNSLGNAAPLQGSGAMRGPYMKMTLFNASPSLVAYTMNALTLWGTQRTHTYSDYRQSVPGGMNTGLTVVGSYGLPGDDNVLIDFSSLTLGASVTEWQPFPLCPGLQYVRFKSSATLAANLIIGSAEALTNGQLGTGGDSSLGILWDVGSATLTNETEGVYYAGHSPTYTILKSTATSPTISMRVMGTRGAYS